MVCRVLHDLPRAALSDLHSYQPPFAPLLPAILSLVKFSQQQAKIGIWVDNLEDDPRKHCEGVEKVEERTEETSDGTSRSGQLELCGQLELSPAEDALRLHASELSQNAMRKLESLSTMAHPSLLSTNMETYLSITGRVTF